MNKIKPKYLNKTIVNTSKVLDYLIKKGESASLTEVSEELNLYPSTVHRILNTLYYLKYVDQTSDNEKYQLGIKALELGMAKLSTIDLIKEAEPFLKELSCKFNENVYLAILFEGMVFYQAKIEAPRTVKLDTHLGSRAYFNCTALGKILMAFLPKDEREEIYKKVGFKKRTKNTIINKTQFEKEVIRVRKQGFAIDNEEHEKDIQCIAAPIRDYSGKTIAALSISGPSYRFHVEKQEQMKVDIVNCAQEISMCLGYKC